MLPCEKADDIKEIKQDVKEVKKLLQQYVIKATKVEKDVALHKKLWGGLVSLVATVILFIFQKQL